MWRDLTENEKKALKGSRSQLNTLVTVIQALLILVFAGFAIDNLVNILNAETRTASSFVGLAADIILACLAVVAGHKARTLLNSDVDNRELCCCEVTVDRVEAESVQVSKVNSIHKETTIANYAYVHPAGQPDTVYRVKTDVEAADAYKSGDTLLLVRPKDDMSEKYMQLLEVNSK